MARNKSSDGLKGFENTDEDLSIDSQRVQSSTGQRLPVTLKANRHCESRLHHHRRSDSIALLNISDQNPPSLYFRRFCCQSR